MQVDEFLIKFIGKLNPQLKVTQKSVTGTSMIDNNDDTVSKPSHLLL